MEELVQPVPPETKQVIRLCQSRLEILKVLADIEILYALSQ